MIKLNVIDRNGETQKTKKNSKKFVASIIAKKIVNSFLDIKKRLN